MTVYLEELTERLTRGVRQLPAPQRQRQLEFFLAAQNPDGGFRGRDTESDLYYTGFALRGLALLDGLKDQVAERAAAYLQQRLATQATIIDFLSLLYGALLLQTSAGIDIFAGRDSNWRGAVASALEELRRPDGGYAKGAEGAVSSTYHTFLVVLCQQLIAWPLSEPEKLKAFVQSRRREDGGYVEIPAMRRSGTNPTSAAIALLRILDACDEVAKEGAIDYLLERQSDEGGLQANTRIPVADTLSTFTGMLTLADLGALEELDLPAIDRFLLGMEVASGGFHGASLDPETDVEYTFYGLAGLALLAARK